MTWFLRQHFQRYNVMTFLINEATLLSFQISLTLAHGVQLYENHSLEKDSWSILPKPQAMENLAKSNYFGLLTSNVLMNTMNCGRCMICFEHIHYDWWPRFGKLVHSQWRWKFHCLASFNLPVETGSTLIGQCTKKSLETCSIMNVLAILWINAVHSIPESTWALN